MIAEYHLNNAYFHSPKVYDGISIYQIGRMFAKNTTVIKEHPHTFLYELTVITSGKGNVTVNGVDIGVQGGDICVSFPGDLHKIKSDKNDPLKFDFLAFTVEDKTLSSEMNKTAKDCAPPLMRKFTDKRITDLVSNAIMENNGSFAFSNDVLSSIYRQIIVYTLRNLRNCADSTHDISSGDILCYSIMNYIDTHLYSIKSLGEIATAAGYSYVYISGIFKKVTSCTVLEYYTNKRLEEAKSLLLKSSKTVSEIAGLLNYSSGYALSRAFSTRFGISPKAFRDKNKAH